MISSVEWAGRSMPLSFSGIATIPHPWPNGPRLILATATAGGAFLGPAIQLSNPAAHLRAKPGYFCTVWNKGATTFTLTDIDLQMSETMAQNDVAHIYIARVYLGNLKFFACKTRGVSE